MYASIGPVLTLVVGLAQAATPQPDFYGTAAPFASDAIYFVMTDRFVDGDRTNDYRDQGGVHPTFDIPVSGAPRGQSANSRVNQVPRKMSRQNTATLINSRAWVMGGSGGMRGSGWAEKGRV